MTPAETVDKIVELQERARTTAGESLQALREADELVKSLKMTYGDRFVCRNVPWKLEHRAIGVVPGNRYWLCHDADVSIIEQESQP